MTAPASRLIASATASVRDAYREGAAQGYRDAGTPPPGSPPIGGGPAPGGGGGDPPEWAQSLARRQQLTQAGMLAAGALREGDRGASSSGPNLKTKS